MSFTEGLELQFNSGDIISNITDRFGSFIVLIWGDGAGGTTSSWSVSKNNQECNIRRLTCCHGADGEYFDPLKEGGGDIRWNLSNGVQGQTFNMKILG